LIRIVRKGRMLPEISWRREDGIKSRGQVVAWWQGNKPIDFFRGERGEAGRADGVSVGGGRLAAGVKEEVMSFTFFVK